MNTSLQQHFEGLRLEPYLCPAGVPTIGYGSTRYEDGSRVTMADAHISESRARSMLERDVRAIQLRIRTKLRKPLSAGEMDALTDFAYNLGVGALFGSTLLKKHRAGDFEGAAQEFKRGVYAGGRKMNGLVRRRRSEEIVYRIG
jgi:lysozyme